MPKFRTLKQVQLPELPKSCRISAEEGRGACPWLDDYIGHSKIWEAQRKSWICKGLGDGLLPAEEMIIEPWIQD
jgi:hypothetical protein